MPLVDVFQQVLQWHDTLCVCVCVKIEWESLRLVHDSHVCAPASLAFIATPARIIA